jgi:hypothetical protein
MIRYRIVRRGSFLNSGVPIFDVEERCWWWWEPRGICESLAEAELRVTELKMTKPIKRQVVKEYSQ